MYQIKKAILVSSVVILGLFTTQLRAENNTSNIEFFVSNNQGEIDLPTAYHRLQGRDQTALQDNVTKVLSNYHLEEQNQEGVLSVYQMSTNKQLTAENTEIISLDPSITLSLAKLKKIANRLATVLNQNSVAVFVPSQQPGVGEIKVEFSNNLPTISEAVELIQKKLPAQYSQAFTLHLATNAHLTFKDEKVNAIEWLGSKPKLAEVKAIFPDATVTTTNGKAFLVFNNKNVQAL